MTITKQCELLAEDYLFLRDKVKGLHSDITRLQNMEQIETLSDTFITTFLEPPASEILYPSIPKATLGRVEEGIRHALKEPLGLVALEVHDAIAKFQEEMWQKVVACECTKIQEMRNET